MDVNTLYRHNYSQVVRDSLINYTGPYSLSVEDEEGSAVLVLDLPPSRQGCFRVDSHTMRIGNEDIPIRVLYTYIPMSLL
jgi:hypothetical protein